MMDFSITRVNRHCNGRVNHTAWADMLRNGNRKHAEFMAVGDAGWVGFQSDRTEAG